MKSLKPINSRPDASKVVQIARAQDPTMPPAAVQTPAPRASAPPRSMVQLNIRVGNDLADQLADRAQAENVAQRILICRALAAAGYMVDQEDLADKPPPKRRGTGRN